MTTVGPGEIMIFVLLLSELVVSDSWNQFILLADWISNHLGISAIWDFQHWGNMLMSCNCFHTSSVQKLINTCVGVYALKLRLGVSVETKIETWGRETLKGKEK